MSTTSIRSPARAALLAACLPVAGLLAAAPALAWNPPHEALSVTVDYRDLNLATEAGATALYQRIRTAAQAVCGERAPDNLSAQHTFDLCLQRAVDGAVNAVNNPLLTSVHRRENHLAAATALAIW